VDITRQRSGLTRRRRLGAVAAAGAALTLATACQGATNELNPSQEHLSVGDRAALGKVLVDDEGRTVYLFDKDEAHESYCTGACASVWPPVTTKGTPAVSTGVDSSKVTLIKRDDGLMQVAYAGHPLYYYQGDTSSDDAYGQEKDQFGAEWYAITATGEDAHATSSNTGGNTGGNTGSNTGGGGYG
jgi:predicted lipoprotein with Yx(FWY)xxD motif